MTQTTYYVFESFMTVVFSFYMLGILHDKSYMILANNRKLVGPAQLSQLIHLLTQLAQRTVINKHADSNAGLREKSSQLQK